MRKFQYVRQIIIILVLFVVTFSFAMFQGGFVSWFIFLVVLPFLLYAFLLAVVPVSITNVRRELSAYRVERGRDIEVTVHFTVKSRLPLLFITAREALPRKHNLNISEGQLGQLFFAGLKREFSWSYKLADLARGEHGLYAIEVSAADFFGWVTRSSRYEHAQTIVVYPQIVDIANTSLSMQYEQGGVVAKYRAVKDTALVSGLRDYQPGDRFSAVHWKSFAKTGNLRTKEFEDRQSQNITLCLDRFSSENFEEAVDLTASIVKSAVRNHNDIAFISGGDKRLFYPSIQTELQLEQVLHHLALVQPNTLPILDSFAGKERLLSKSVLLIVAGDLSASLLALLQKESMVARQIVCFVTAPQMTLDNVVVAPNCKLLALEREQFAKVFSEVNKR